MSDDTSDPLSLPMTPAIDWLLRQAASAATPGALLGELCGRLVAEGLPIAGARLAIASLDPLVTRTVLHWQRAEDRVVEELQLHGMTPAEEAPADGVGLQLALAGTKHEMSWLTEPSAGFGAAQRGYLVAVCLALSAPLQVVIERSVTAGLLQAYLGRRSAGRVLSGEVRRGSGEVIEAVVWISDLRDFTLVSETLPSDQVIAALNDCCGRLVGAIQPFGGEVLKFIGDGLLAIFPLAPRGARATCDAALAAVRAARSGMARLDEERLHASLPPLPFGIGLHLGDVVYGNIGAPDRLDFTAIGAAVNLASRIEGLCRPLTCPVLVSEAVAARCTQPLTALGHHAVRGAARAVALFTLPELAPPGCGEGQQ